MKIDISRFIPIAAFLMAFFLPLHTGLSNLFLILIFVSSFFTYVIQRKFEKRNPRLLIFTLLPIFVLIVVGLLYSDPLFYGTKILGQTLAFILCPLLLLYLPGEILLKTRKNLALGLVIGSVISVSYLLVNTTLNYYATRPFPSIDGEFLGFYYTYHKFTAPFIEFAAYLGAYVVYSIATLYYRVYKKKSISALEVFSLIILSVSIVFINSRIIMLLYAIITLAAVIMVAKFYIRQQRHKALVYLFGITAIVGGSAFFILSDSFIETRLHEELQWELSDQRGTGYNESIIGDSRIPRWKAALEVIKEKPIWGYGTYMEKKELAEQYQKDGLWSSLKNRYDAHNMYLSYTIEYGIIGFLLYLLFLGSNAVIALKNGDFLYSFFVLMVAAISIFESYLSNNAGITFVALFMTVYLISQKSIYGKR